MEKTEILTKKRYGDVSALADKMSISVGNAHKILSRSSSKRYAEAVELLSKIIASREEITNDTAEVSELVK